MRDVIRRVRALEGRSVASSSNRHCLMWWPGQAWADLIAAYGPERIERGHRVTLIKFAAEGEDRDPVMERDGPVATAWLRKRGAAHA